MQRKTKIGVGVGLAVVVLGAMVVFGGGDDGVVEVRMEPVATRDLVAAVTASGNIEAKSQVDVQSEVTARILRITVEEGDLVERGQLLIELDEVQFKGAVDRAEAFLISQQASQLQARTNRDQARRALDRALELKRTAATLISDEAVEQAQQSFDVSEAVLRSNEAQVMQAQASLKEARDNLARTKLYAPISGRVVRLAVEEGEVAQTGTFSRDVGLLMRIADLSAIQALVKVDETDVVRLSLDDSVSVEIDAFPDSQFAGRVTRIANSAAALSATGQSADRAIDFQVEITIDNPPADVRPDLSMTARIITDVRTGALSIPIIALTARAHTPTGDAAAQGAPLGGTSDTTNTEREGVFVVENGIAMFRPVKIGIVGDQHFEVLSGLKTGEVIVSGSYQAIRELVDSSRVSQIDTTQVTGPTP